MSNRISFQLECPVHRIHAGMSTTYRLQQIAESSPLVHADLQYGARGGRRTIRYSSGTTANADSDEPGRRYLVASITKPIVAAAVLRLAAEGHFNLTDRLRDFLPEFHRAHFRRITVRHLLTHTSGLPDMPRNNAELRAGHAPLPAFATAAAIADPGLDFDVGTDCRYSSMAFLLLGQIVETVTGSGLGQFLQSTFFRPLGMTDTRLGLSESEAHSFLPHVLPSVLPAWQPNADNWGWSSRYWRCLGAPWGGLMSTAADLAKFAIMMLSDGAAPDGTQILPSSVVKMATRNQVSAQTHPGETAASRRWGFGWRLQWQSHSASFGDFVSPDTYGHWGACGTLLWIDPLSQRYAVILTTTPYEDSRSVIQRLSNVIATTSRTRRA